MGGSTDGAALPHGAAISQGLRSNPAAHARNYGRGLRTHAHVSYAEQEGLPSSGAHTRAGVHRMGRLGGKAGANVSRLVRLATDPNAQRMEKVYVRRSENEDLRDTYHTKAPMGGIAGALWGGLAGGCTAEGMDYGVGRPVLRPAWPGALPPISWIALQQGMGPQTYEGAGLPQVRA